MEREMRCGIILFDLISVIAEKCTKSNIIHSFGKMSVLIICVVPDEFKKIINYFRHCNF